MSPNWVIRKMEVEDIEEVYQLDLVCFSLPWPRRAYDYEVKENPNSRCWVIQEMNEAGKGAIIAMAVCWIILDELHVATFAVLPQYRRQKLGHALMRHALMEGQKEGANLAYLEVRRSNLAAQALYQQFGFFVNGERKNYYPDSGGDALLMTLENLQALTL
jgi:[ribosomal protein S18]-alanine N-acetyltransferase